MKTANKRKRVSRDQVRSNAKAGNSRRASFFKLPKGKQEWAPEKPAVLLLNIVPYEVTDERHPDRVEKGVLWYKRPFKVHRNVGPDGIQLVCPTSIGKKCPICTKRAELAKDYKANEQACKDLKAQDWVVYNVISQDDPDEVVVFAMSRGKFAGPLEMELQEAPDDSDHLFFETTKEGRTIKVRFSERSFDGRNFLEATKFDFKPRPPMDEDDILSKTVNLDQILIVESFETIKALFEAAEEEELEVEAEEEEVEEIETPPPAKKKAKPAPEPEPEEEEAEEEEAEEEEPASPPAKKKAKPAPPPEDDPEEEVEVEEEEVEEEEVEEEPAPPPKKTKTAPKKSAKPAADDDDWDV